MKRLANTVLLLLLTVTPAALAAPERNNMSKILTDNSIETRTTAVHSDPTVSAQDLYLFGVISLGIIGLFWIRRHTSEL